MTRNRIFQYIGIALLTLATLGLEVGMTRIFSVSFWYNFVFMIISIALLGTGLSGVLLSFGRFSRLSETKTNGLLTAFTALFAVSIVFAFLQLNRIDLKPGDAFRNAAQWWNMVKYYGILLIPFFFSGTTIGLIFVRYSKDISRFYFWDLIGASAGCLIILVLVPNLGGESTIFAIALLALGAALFFSFNLKPWWPALILIAGTLFFPYIKKASNYVDLITRVDDKRPMRGYIDYKTWNNFSFCVITDQPGRIWKGVNLDFACFTPIYRGGVRAMGSHRIPFDILTSYKKKPVVALIGSGGGREVKGSLDYGAKKIYAIEFNPTIVNVLKGRYAKFTKDLHNKPHIILREAEGRSFLRNAHDNFDLIVQNNTLTQTASTAGAYALAEDYVLTVESFVDYLGKLNDKGILYISQPQQLGVRLVTIAIEAFRKLGWTNVAASVCSMKSVKGYTREFIMIKKGGYSKAESRRLIDMAGANGMILNYAPFSKQNSLHQQLIDAANDKKKLSALYDSSYSDIRPSTDNWPFFSQRTRFRNLSHLIAEITRKGYARNRSFAAISKAIRNRLSRLEKRIPMDRDAGTIRTILKKLNTEYKSFRKFRKRDMISFKTADGKTVFKKNVLTKMNSLVDNLLDRVENLEDIALPEKIKTLNSKGADFVSLVRKIRDWDEVNHPSLRRKIMLQAFSLYGDFPDSVVRLDRKLRSLEAVVRQHSSQILKINRYLKNRNAAGKQLTLKIATLEDYLSRTAPALVSMIAPIRRWENENINYPVTQLSKAAKKALSAQQDDLLQVQKQLNTLSAAYIRYRNNRYSHRQASLYRRRVLNVKIGSLITDAITTASVPLTGFQIETMADDVRGLKETIEIHSQWGYWDFKNLTRRMPQSLGILVINLIQALIFSVVCIILPLGFFKLSGLRQLKQKGRFFLYFMGLGFGFMFLEVSLMQRFTLFLGHPIYAITTTLFTILISSSIGAFLSGKLKRFTNPLGCIRFALTGIFIMTLFHILLVPGIFNLFLGSAMWLKVIVSFIVLIPLGMMMGMMFPSGIRWASLNAPDAVPWAWGVNGFASVLGSTLTVLMGMLWGFNAVILIALAVYGIGALAFLTVGKNSVLADR